MLVKALFFVYQKIEVAVPQSIKSINFIYLSPVQHNQTKHLQTREKFVKK